MRVWTGSKRLMFVVAALAAAAPAAAWAQAPFVQDTRMEPAPSVSDGSCSGPDCPLHNLPQAVDQATALAKAQGNAGAPEIDAKDKDIGKHIVDGMHGANDFTDGDSSNGNLSLYYSYNFKSMHPDLWQDDYWTGYANPTYWEKTGFYSWKLKPGVSAAAAIKDWLRGRTISECMTTVRALQTDALRAAVGDAAFDKAFGSADGSAPTKGPLVISPDGSSIEPFLRETDANRRNDEGSIGHRDANPGEHYYFQNHPKYLLKHPGGAWQGENAIFAGTAGKELDEGMHKKGEQVWTGFGANDMTEQELYQEMIEAYNAPRDDRDLAALTQMFGADSSKWPKEYQENSGSFPDQITVKDVLTAEPYAIDGETRTGGFLVRAGVTLDAGKVKELRGNQKTVAVGGGQ